VKRIQEGGEPKSRERGREGSRHNVKNIDLMNNNCEKAMSVLLLDTAGGERGEEDIRDCVACIKEEKELKTRKVFTKIHE